MDVDSDDDQELQEPTIQGAVKDAAEGVSTKIRGPPSKGPLFEGVVIVTASDRFKKSLTRVERDPWDTEAWIALAEEASRHGSGNIPQKTVLRRLLDRFPLSGKYWRALGMLELEAGNAAAVDEVFKAALLDCEDLELWQLYLEKVKRSQFGAATGAANASAVSAAAASDASKREEVVKAFELALEHVGADSLAFPLWHDYVEFLKSWEERSANDTGSKVVALRKVYHRALSTPIDNLDKLWREYEAFEVSRSEHLARVKFLPEVEPRYKAARAVHKERRQVWDGVRSDTLAAPPRGTEEEDRQLEVWGRAIAYERDNPERVDAAGLLRRVRHAFRQALCCLRFFPEMWYEHASFEAEAAGVPAAAAVYSRALEVLPDSELLRAAAADLHERAGDTAVAKSHWLRLLTPRPNNSASTWAHVLFQRFIRRTEGKEAARRAFAATRKLRASGALTYHVYLAASAMELHANGDVATAQRVLERGLAQHATLVAEPEYVGALAELLARRGDEQNLRVLLERALAATPAERARPIWDRLVDVEMFLARSGGSLARLEAAEARRAAAYPEDARLRGLMRLWQRGLAAGAGVAPQSRVDALCFERCAGLTVEEDAAAAAAAAGLAGRGGFGAAAVAGGGRRRRRGERETDAAIAAAGAAGGAAGAAATAATAAADEAAAVEIELSPLVPPFLRELVLRLPRAIGPAPDVDVLLTNLRDAALPPKKTFLQSGDGGAGGGGVGGGGGVSAVGDAGGGSGRNRGKRQRGGGDSDDEEEEGIGTVHKRPTGDVFRERQQLKLEPGL